MRPGRLFRRGALAFVGIGALAGGAAPARTDRAAEQVGEVFESPVRHRLWRTFRDPVTGEKWLESADGERAASVDDVVQREEAELTDLERRVAPDLLTRMRDPARADEPVLVVFRMARQPATEAAEEAAARHDARQDALAGRLRSIAALVASRRGDELRGDPRDEATFLSVAEREELRRLRTEIRTLKAARRREVLDFAKPAARADQEALVATLRAVPGAVVVSQATLLSCVSARVPPGALAAVLDAHPEVAHADPSKKLEATLDVSVGVVGASSWWNAGFDGSTSTKVAILDTGCDSAHSALGNVGDEGVFLSAGSGDNSFADSASSTDDYHGHGTHVAGIAASNDSTYAGVAPGAALMNAKCGYLWLSGSTTGGSFQDTDIYDAGDWAADNGADVFNCSFGGGGTTNGSDNLALFFDAIVHDLGIAVAVAAGNSGSSSGSIGIPGDAYNVVTVGNWDDNGSSSTSDDSIANSSSRGPCSDGRRKPDIAAPGTNIASCDAKYESTGSSWVSYTGTSMASPHVAGALAILDDYGVATRPEGMKALLLTNANNASPFPSNPGNTWGYGAMDLSATYTNRASVHEGSLTSGGSRFVLLSGPSLASSKRVTLVWNRRVVSRNNAAPNTYSSQMDLDLYLYEQSDGTSRGSANSGLESVEQVKTSSSSNSPVVKVYRASSSFPSGLSTQRWAVATEATGGLSEKAGPNLTCAYTALPAAVSATTDFTVTVNVTNAGDLTALSPTVTLTLPTGYSFVSGSSTQSIATLSAGSSTTASWTVRSPSSGSGSKSFSASAKTTSYGESFNGAAKTGTQTLDVDAPTNPSVSLATGAAYTRSATVTATLSASDAGSGVTSMRTRNAGDAWGDWVAYATSANVTLASGDGSRSLEAQFRDAAGNVSSTASDAIVVDTVAPAGTFAVAGGASWATTAPVTLSMSLSDGTSGLSEMRFSDDGSAWSAWAPYAATAAWTLPGTDGAKTVFAQVRDAAGNSTSTLSDGISLDRVAPSGSITVDAGNTWAASSSVTLSLSASDATSGVASMRFSDDGTNWASWTTFAATAPWTLPGSDGAKTVYAQFRDTAGNVSSTASDGISLDRTLPSGTVTIAGGADWTGTRDVTLATTWFDGGSSVSEMRFSDDAVAWSAWTAVAATADWVLPEGDGAKSVHVQFRDVAGNVSPRASDTVGLDLTGPTGSVTIAAGAAWTTSPDVALTPSSSDPLSGVASMRFSNDGASWSAWTPFAATAAWSLTGPDGTRSVFAQFRDAVGNVSASSGDTIGLDRSAPSGTLTIADGAAWTTVRAVALAVSASDATSGVVSMRLSGDGAAWTSWTSYEESAAWTLSAGDGTKPVYVQFADVAGNVSSAASDTIGLDGTAPTVSLAIADGAAWVPSVAVSLAPTAGDQTSGVAEMRFSDDASSWSGWTKLADAAAWTLPSRDGAKIVYAQVRDTAGNVSAAASDTVGLDTEAPWGSVTIDYGVAATNQSLVNLSTVWNDATSGVTDMRFSDDAADWSAWTPVKGAATRLLPFGDGERAVHAQYRDRAGNVSSPAYDVVVVDTAAPTGTFRLAGGSDYLAPGAPLTAELTATDADGGSGVASFRWSHDRGVSWSEWAAADATVEIGIPAGARDVRRTVFGQFRDGAGNVSGTASASIHVLAEAPQDADAAAAIDGKLAAGDVDAYSVRLVAGDRLDAVVAPRLPKGATATIGIDVHGPSGELAATRRSNARGVGARIRSLRAAETGTYVVVVRVVGETAAEIPYRLTTTERIGRASIQGRAAGADQIAFDAVEGRELSGSLRGLRLASAVLEGPEEEPLGFQLKPAPGRAFALPRQTLAFGSGSYVLRVAPAERGKVSWALRLALPRRARAAAETVVE